MIGMWGAVGKEFGWVGEEGQWTIHHTYLVS